MKLKTVYHLIIILLAIFLPQNLKSISCSASSAASIVVLNPATNNTDFIFTTTTTTVDTKFNLTVWLFNITNLFAYQVLLEINDTQLNITRAWLPKWDPKWIFYNNQTVSPEPAFYDNDNDTRRESVLIGDSLLRGSTSSGEGCLAIIEIQIVSLPSVDGKLESELNITNPSTILLDNEMKDIAASKINGYYCYIWEYLVPTPIISPSFIQFGPEPPTVVGKVFNVNVHLVNLSASFNLKTIKFSLNYNPDLIKPLECKADPVWKIASISQLEDSIIVFLSRPQATLQGSIKLLEIDFEVKYQGFYPESNETNIEIRNFTLYSTEGVKLPSNPPINGKILIKGLPQPPWIEMQPINIDIKKVSPSVEKEFKINLTLKNLNASWKLRSIVINLTYDANILEAIGVIKATYLEEFGTVRCTINMTKGRIIIRQYIVAPTSEPSGNGTIATIIFHTSKLNSNQSLTGKVTITTITLADKEGNSIPLDTSKLINTATITIKTVQKSSISLRVTEKSVTVGSQIKLYGEISPPKENAIIIIMYRKIGDEAWFTLNETVTDKNGEYSYQWDPQEPGCYEFKARWQGDEWTAESQSELVYVIVQEAPKMPLQTFELLFTLLIAVIVILAIIYKKRKSKPQ